MLISSASISSAVVMIFEDALARYRLTAEEFLAWQKAIDKWGMQGLRTTRIQHYGRP